MLQVGISMAFSHILLNRLIFIMIIILSTAKFTKNDTELNYNVLNGTFKPLHYGVKIEYDVYRNIFLGECNITIQINRPTENITINANTIFINQIDLFDNDNNKIFSIQKFSFINEFKKKYIHLDFIKLSGDVLYPDRYILKFKYIGMISEDEMDADKEKDIILNKESIEVIKAVELFPYWNEAIFKTTFNISIKHHKDYKFLSTMPIRIQVENLDDTLWTYFDKSPLMFPEHLTIVISTFTNFFVSTRNVKFWYKKEVIDQMRFAENIVRVVLYYLKLKSRGIILPKLDYFVIEDFEHSNEKTRGFILLRQEDIIYDNTFDHIARKMKVANFIARKTISYWYDDVPLWSKEGLITFLAAYVLDQTGLYNRMMDLFVVQIQQESLRFDTLPIDSLSLHTANISAVHSLRSSFHYIKASTIWRMLYHILSDNVFWACINTYVQYDQRNSTNTKNLTPITLFWAIVDNVVVKNMLLHNMRKIKDVVDTWSTEGYYPVLYMTRNYSTNTVLISYINSEHLLTTSLADTRQYEIFVVYATKSHMRFGTRNFWLTNLSPHYSLYMTDDKDWIILNLQAGYYRVNYNLDNWKKLACDLYNESNTIHALNRAQIIDDAFYFLTQKQLNINLFWDITSFLLKDTDYVAWYPMIKAVEYMTCVWGVQHNALIKEVIKEMFNKLLQNIGYDDNIDESDLIKCLREEAVKWACVLGEPECRKIATSKLKEHFKFSIHNSLRWREWLYCKGLMTANPLLWDKVFIKWERTSDDAFLNYLTCYTDPVIIRIYLESIMTERFYYNSTDSKTSANNILLIVAKHARTDTVLKYILNNIGFFEFSLNKQIDHIAILIVIITNEHSVIQFEKITKFAENLSEKQLIDAVKQKIIKRKLECEKRVTY
ncbi:thyrotropin-releasing hormone-degrading ectoenzyme-like [Linepithema humile]|uniref:thyrotropin-releasing hormone-degrading ectoenzyme-like n=1 Tax=Linepithema humile TaxID=83485 RepID=UPI00351F10A8